LLDVIVTNALQFDEHHICFLAVGKLSVFS